ncbi:hypothetical protein [Pararhizobium sp. A13]|uniref:hypothetical protein n=1 Tax=Pararhizobium sp. A13 TaxID=3133975 RepID=UPI003244C0A1
MPDEYAPKYRWRVTWPDPEDAGSHKTDFSGWDGDVRIGRIRFEPNGLQKGTWQWSGLGPHVRERLLPHQSYEDTARKAAAMVEDYYERLMAHNGLEIRQPSTGE